MKRLLLILFLVLIAAVGCKKEPTTWKPNWKTPLVKGRVSLNDLPDYTKENADGYASLVYDDTVYSFRIDTLIKLPDTSLVQKTAVAFSSVTLDPGSFIDNNDIDQLYDLGEISLKRVIIKKGMAFITISSPWGGKTKAVFEFPKVKDHTGAIFKKTYFLEAGSIYDPYIVRDTFDISNYDFDLTGADGSLANNLTANMAMYSNETTASFTISNLDTVLLSLSFEGLEAKYARGYFGQYNITDTTTIKFPQIRKLSGLIEMDSLNMSLNIQNGFDLIAQTRLSTLSGKNTQTNQTVPLNFPYLNQFLNLNPATGGLYDYVPSNYYLDITNTNSTILPFIQNLPDSLAFGYEIKINPDGNTGAGTDQFFPNSRINLMANAELPLHIKLNDFSLRDTFKIDASSIGDDILNGIISLSYTNTFGLGADVKLFLLNESGVKTDSLVPLNKLNEAKFDTGTSTTLPASGILNFDLNSDRIQNLKNARKVVVSIIFNTADLDFVKLYMSDYIDFKIISDLNLKISI